MHRVFGPGAFVVSGLAIAAAVGNWAVAQQVCKTDAAALSSPTQRFQDHGDGTVTDVELQLMWMRCSSGQQQSGARCSGAAGRYEWADARRLADTINRDGNAFFNDWRLPSVRELATISERRCSNPRINLAVFPETPAAAYWSSTLRPSQPGISTPFTLDFGAGGVQFADAQERMHVRLVRNAP